MLFSCKITSSVLSHLERQGEDLTPLLEATALPEEFLKDPSYWMQAQEMEKFLSAVSRIPTQKLGEETLLEQIGHATPELRSWGVFDSVLRMMALQDVFAQPSRFLSYFISPEPPVDKVIRTDKGISFDLPVPVDQFPNTVAYLRAAFETLPVFSGRQLGHCRWEGIRLTMEWDDRQKNIFNETDLGHHISPELMRSIVAQLEQHQLELQHKNAELEVRNEQLRKAYQELETDMRKKLMLKELSTNPISTVEYISPGSVRVLQAQVARLGDYMVRAQQLVTLMVGADRMNPTTKEAMKRMDWEWVKQQFPVTMSTCIDILQKTSQENSDSGSANKGELNV